MIVAQMIMLNFLMKMMNLRIMIVKIRILMKEMKKIKIYVKKISNRKELCYNIQHLLNKLNLND